MAMRQASSSFLHLIDNSETLWNNNPAPLQTRSSYRDAFMALTKTLHKDSTLTQAKHETIAQHLAVEGQTDKCSRLCSKAYYHLFLFGQEGLACLSLPLLLCQLFDLPLWIWQVLCTVLMLLGLRLIAESLIRHSAEVLNFSKKTGLNVSYIHTRQFAVIYPGPFHPLLSFYTVFLGNWALSIYGSSPPLTLGTAFTGVMIVFSLNLLTDLSSSFGRLNLHPYRFYIKDRNRGLPLPGRLSTLTFSHLIYAALQSILVPVFLVAPMLLHFSTGESRSSYVSLCLCYMELLLSAVAVVFFNVYKLLSGGDFRWWWISFLSPVFSVMIAVLLCDRTFHSFQIGLLFGSLAGTISHAIVWFNLIGFANGVSYEMSSLCWPLLLPWRALAWILEALLDAVFELTIGEISLPGHPRREKRFFK